MMNYDNNAVLWFRIQNLNTALEKELPAWLPVFCWYKLSRYLNTVAQQKISINVVFTRSQSTS